MLLQAPGNLKSSYIMLRNSGITPFQNLYFSENLVAPGIAPGHLDL
jgi:hypothetical protein